ncbi:MAG: hypothetical protein Q4C20_00700 [Erysipelotrichaceae bacterium]|nr:hypothetical protein [Erysipelotrichaceae bacterium]
MDFKNKVEAFRNSCKMYRSETEKLGSLDENAILKKYIEDDVSFVEETFSKLEDECGLRAKNTVWELFVEERTQVDVAFEMNMSRRQLQYLINKWLHAVFEDTE